MFRITALTLAAAVSHAQAQTSIPEILSSISEKRIEANIRKLVSFGTRNSLSDPDDAVRGIGAARRWIKAELERCATGTPLQIAFDEHLVEAGARVPKPTRFVNVVATLPGTRSLASTRCSSNATCSRPPDAFEQPSSSPLIQRRAAPMPRVGDCVSEAVWRVPNDTSLRMFASMRAGEIAPTISAMRGLRSPGAPSAGALAASASTRRVPAFMY